jgi:alpha-L-arabinofuranosidase
MILCNKLNIRPLIVVNLYTGTPAESAAWVRYVKEKGYRVFGWQLGNEVFLPPYRNRIKNIDEYISVAKKHANAMKAVDPNIRLGVVAHHGNIDFHDKARVIRADKWNNRLGSEKFFDAYTTHLYLHTENSVDIKRDFENVKVDLFELSDAILETALISYAKSFPGKQMWVTEWNIMFRENKDLSDTQLHALYCGDFFINMLNKNDMITTTEYHVLAAPWNGFPLISAKGENPGNFVTRACYYSFDVLKNALTESDKRYAVSLENAPVLKKVNKYMSKSVSGISATSIGKQNKTFILITNRTASDVTAKISIDNAAYNGKVKYSYLTAEKLNSTGEQNKIQVQSKVIDSGMLILPANTLGVIEIL